MFQEKEQKRRIEALKENKGLSLQGLCGDDVSMSATILFTLIICERKYVIIFHFIQGPTVAQW